MADIFISYASDDLSKAESLAKALIDHGWSVWWDRTIPPGKTFDLVIEQAIEAAKCIVVLWSKKSIKSDWVKEEAAAGKHRNILVPAKIDPIDPPFGFRRIQAADLTTWKKNLSHPGFISLLNAISDIAGSPNKPENRESLSNISISGSEQQFGDHPEKLQPSQPASGDPTVDTGQKADEQHGDAVTASSIKGDFSRQHPEEIAETLKEQITVRNDPLPGKASFSPKKNISAKRNYRFARLALVYYSLPYFILLILFIIYRFILNAAADDILNQVP